MAEPRVVILTGASSGIGRASALMLAGRGYHLVLMARGVDRLERVADECRRTGAGSVVVHPGDVADGIAVDRMVAHTVDAHGRVDAVVHSAGVAAYGHFTDIPADVFDRVIRTNLIGAATVGRATLRQFALQGHGRAVFVGSLLGKIVTPGMSPYVVSKWGVHALVRTMQIETRGMRHVSVSLVSPGGVDTPIYAWSASMSGRQGQPPPPVDPPEKVARVIVRALGHPRREASVGLANHVAVLGFRGMPEIFDRLVTPLMGQFGLDPQPVAKHRGNIDVPLPDPVTSYGDRDARSVRAARRVVNATAALFSRTGTP